MKTVKIVLEDGVYRFYQQVGQKAGGFPVERVISDTLFKLAGELALEAIHKKQAEEL